MDFTPLQKKFLEAYKTKLISKEFYLTGGTLLATRYLNHRRSLDLDFFSDKKFELAPLEKVISNLVQETGLRLGEFRHIYDRYEWEISDKHDHVKIEFVFYDFKPLKQRIMWHGLRIDNLHDLTANKTMALIERHEPKDIFDIYYIIQKTGWTINKFLQLLKKKFDLTITPQTFLREAELALERLQAIRGLLLFEDKREQDKLIDEIHDYFDKEAYRYLRKILD